MPATDQLTAWQLTAWNAWLLTAGGGQMSCSFLLEAVNVFLILFHPRLTPVCMWVITAYTPGNSPITYLRANVLFISVGGGQCLFNIVSHQTHTCVCEWLQPTYMPRKIPISVSDRGQMSQDPFTSVGGRQCLFNIVLAQTYTCVCVCEWLQPTYIPGKSPVTLSKRGQTSSSCCTAWTIVPRR